MATAKSAVSLMPAVSFDLHIHVYNARFAALTHQSGCYTKGCCSKECARARQNLAFLRHALRALLRRCPGLYTYTLLHIVMLGNKTQKKYTGERPSCAARLMPSQHVSHPLMHAWLARQN
jgi:hypothetical protein